ncbi:p21-activated protein kinase-interacting protein 1-like [Seminavis robusta]|uniref:P21-activated protein kinase-interacting protein 1-like n=1 Tax=Seminavis robusta TaxID=568900 RepID=A0A9N8HAM4_9STRA|nr:p21-activated protein kinase-interacting protein 1-like [Seminavis robusta]|eukprot:Sro154_g069920.1 p21-activated protein kinase-interacting protein 1-like (513) ;mRNA; r:24977-26515
MTSSSSDDESDTHHDATTSSESLSSSNPLPAKVIVTVGTYDGVVAGWELKQNKKNQRKLEISFATPVHGGSVRCLCLASQPNNNHSTNNTMPGSLLSTGYDEMLKTHDWHRRLTSSGEVKTPMDFGTPVVACFAPPPPPIATSSATSNQSHSTHCLVGFSSGKLVIYKKRDWSVQHVLAGHVGGLASVAVHPSGKLALTGGHADGKLKLWDLTKGRLSFVTSIQTKNPIVSLAWSHDGSLYAFCHGSHITVRDVETGEDWCHVELPSRVNQLALIQGHQGIFVAAACNDGSLPVVAVKTIHDDTIKNAEARRAIMAIEPVEGPVAGEERYKCICTVAGYYVATANSAGVISLMNLQGAITMMMTDNDNNDNDQENPDNNDENPAGSDSDNDDDQEEMAVDIIDAVQLGTGARVTCLVAWACQDDDEPQEEHDNDDDESQEEEVMKPKETNNKQQEQETTTDKKRKLGGNRQDLEMDPKEVEKARALVAKAKKMQKKKDSKKNKKRRKVAPGE